MSLPFESAAGRPLPDDQSIGPLVRLGGPREAVAAERLARVRAAVHAEWRRDTKARSRRRLARWSLGALAAAAALLVVVRGLDRPDPGNAGPAPTLATIDALRGPDVRVLPAAGEPAAGRAAFQVGDALRAGQGLDTGGGRAAIRMAGGASIRLDRSTRLRLIGEDSVMLDAGAVYVDSGPGPDRLPIEIRTALGSVRDIGTRFEVRLDRTRLKVRVRDGLVRLTQDGETHDARRGDELSIDDRGVLVRRSVPIDGAEWAWARAVTRPFVIEGRSLRDFLDWVTGEHGWRLGFATAAAEAKAEATTLHGSIDGLTPFEALGAVLPTTGLDHRIEGDRLLILLPEAATH